MSGPAGWGGRAVWGGRVLRGVVVGAAALAAGATVVGTTTATGAPTSPIAAADQTAGREITRFDVTAELGADGVAHVTLDFDFDFGNDPGHGPLLTLPTRQDAGDKNRLYRISGISCLLYT